MWYIVCYEISYSLWVPLQISEVVNSMKDLIDFCREHKVGPIGKFLFDCSISWYSVKFL